jgi:hypothetical protein
MMTKSINTLVLALVAFNAVTVLGLADPAIINAPVQKRENELEARQCESNVSFSSFFPGYHGIVSLFRLTEAFTSPNTLVK